jgi:heme exporter protein A
VQLVIDNLSVDRGARRVLSNLSLRIGAGEALILTGPNGSGKTTLIRTIAGFLKPVAGDIVLEGSDPDRETAQYCHYVGHLNGVKPSLTVEENLAFWGAYLREPEKGPCTVTEISDALEAFGLNALASIPVAYLSAGQKRRAGLARLLIAKRPVWLLDEPTVSLDAESSTRLAKQINHHVAMGGLVLAATHFDLGLASARTVDLANQRGASP